MKIFIFLYFLLSGVTWVAGRTGAGLEGRVAAPDPLMAGLIGVILLTRLRRLRIPPVGVAALTMVVAFAVGVAFGISPGVGQPLVNWIVHLFLVLGFIALYNVIAPLPMEERLQYAHLWVRAAGIIAVVALWDLLAPMVGLPGIAASLGRASRIQGGAVGTFRNTGQAGIFFVTAIATAFPLQRILAGRQRREVSIWFVVLTLATVFTVKRSALIALALMLLLWFLREQGWKSRLRTIAMATAAGLVLLPVFVWLFNNSPAFRWRITYKINSSVVQDVEEGDSFLLETAGAGVRAFSDRPLTGVGLGGVAGNYTAKYEIHSTYFSVLAETGLIGVTAYLWFVLLVFLTCLRPLNDDARSRVFSRLLLPGLVGLFVAFGYTNHLRKREFWITTAIATALLAPIPRRRDEAFGSGESLDFTRLAPEIDSRQQIASLSQPTR